MAPRPRVLITNQLVANGGDAAIGLAVGQQVREALDGEVTYADTYPELARGLYPGLAFRPQIQRRFSIAPGPRGLRRALLELNILRFTLSAARPRLRRALLRPAERAELAEYASFDLIVPTGGTYLVEHYVLPPRFAEIRIALALAKPVVLFTQSLGPFETRYNRFWMRRLLREADAVLVRDELSLKHIADLGLPATLARKAPDAAFSLRPPASRDRAGVAVSVRSWRHVAGGPEGQARYEDAIAAMVAALVRDHDKHVLFVSSCQGLTGYLDDSEVARRIVRLLPDDVAECVEVDSAYRRPDELQAVLAGAEAAICTRMHMAILALTVDTPVLAIEYEFKTRELFAGLGMTDRVLSIDTITGPEGVAALDRFLQDPDLPETVAAARRESAVGVDILREVMTARQGA